MSKFLPTSLNHKLYYFVRRNKTAARIFFQSYVLVLLILTSHYLQIEFTLKADSHIACRSHAVPLPFHTVKGLECVFPV